jgi:hypothetical protein
MLRALPRFEGNPHVFTFGGRGPVANFGGTRTIRGGAMHYIDQWKALSARIRGLAEAVDFDCRCFGTTNTGNSRFLRTQASELVDTLTELKAPLEHARHATASSAVGSVLDLQQIKAVRESTGTPDAQVQNVRSCLVALRAFEAEMTFLLSDSQQAMRTRSERAFRHLIWQIAVDDELRQKWQKAFEQGEVQCEKLGAVHLLWHGIFAFKIDAIKGRTDLVFGEPLGDQDTYADALVLTEWKKATSASDARTKFANAKKQADNYAHGALAGNELRGYRYAIVVTEKQVETPPDEPCDDVTYRHINIAVDPGTPSHPVSARNNA